MIIPYKTLAKPNGQRHESENRRCSLYVVVDEEKMRADRLEAGEYEERYADIVVEYDGKHYEMTLQQFITAILGVGAIPAHKYYRDGQSRPA